jgi:hypothetical protein
MKETQAIIERVRRVNAAYQHLELAVDESLTKIKPGQSLLARLNDRWDPYLREQWWPVNLVNNRLIIERPGVLRYEPGQVVSVLGLIGQPFRFRRSLRNVLLIAYNTPPTCLLMTVPWLLSNNISVTMVLLGSAAEYATQHIPAQVEIVRGDEELNWANRVMTVGWADQVLAAVGQDDEMMRFGQLWTLFTQLRAEIPKNYLFGVFQPVLPCGAGACSACMLRMSPGMKLVCTEGPSFDLTQVMPSS